MPRLSTGMPVALATTACSNEIFDPSANDVTMWASWPQRWAKSAWVVGLR
jgi:hypothetical protein